MNLLLITLLALPLAPAEAENTPTQKPAAAKTEVTPQVNCQDVFDRSADCEALQKETPLVTADVIPLKNKAPDALRKKVAKRFIGLGSASIITSVGLFMYSHSVGEQLKTLASQKALDGESFRLLRNRERGFVWGAVLTSFAGAMFLSAGTSFLVFDPKQGTLTDAFSFMTE